MTTHVFIVDETTFPYHLQYLFAGTGSGEKDVDFNQSSDSTLYPGQKHAAESALVGMMADCCRIRKGDYVIFYLQATKGKEGRFYGIFTVSGTPFLDKLSNTQYLKNDLKKNLTFRVRLAPYQVYAKGVTEWKALDEINQISSPCQMLWSLIYRKLKGNRGNTMITIYEAERLMNLIRRENDNIFLRDSQSYTYDNGEIVNLESCNEYLGQQETFDIIPRLLAKHNSGKSYESHLQMYLTQNIGQNNNLDEALGISNSQVEWLGNEVSCGVGMQRIDVMISTVVSDTERIIMPVELKAIPAYPDVLRQIRRYIDWIEQYYVPNRISTIQPVLLCQTGGLSSQMNDLFHRFNNESNGRYLPLRYIEYTIENGNIYFNQVRY